MRYYYKRIRFDDILLIENKIRWDTTIREKY